MSVDQSIVKTEVENTLVECVSAKSVDNKLYPEMLLLLNTVSAQFQS